MTHFAIFHFSSTRLAIENYFRYIWCHFTAATIQWWWWWRATYTCAAGGWRSWVGAIIGEWWKQVNKVMHTSHEEKTFNIFMCIRRFLTTCSYTLRHIRCRQWIHYNIWRKLKNFSQLFNFSKNLHLNWLIDSYWHLCIKLVEKNAVINSHRDLAIGRFQNGKLH